MMAFTAWPLSIRFLPTSSSRRIWLVSFAV